MTFVGGGVLIDVYFGNRFVVTPSFAPTWWRGKTDKLDLGHGLEFRSQIEFAYRFDDRSRLGLRYRTRQTPRLATPIPAPRRVA